MRKCILGLSLILLVFTSCDPSKKIVGNGGSDDCKDLKMVKNSFFNGLSSANYQLNALRQNGEQLEMDIVSSESIVDANLFWTGAVRKSYPPQAAVKLILTKADQSSTESKSDRKHTLCFNMSAMQDYGERIKIYIMDDEEAIDLYFPE